MSVNKDILNEMIYTLSALDIQYLDGVTDIQYRVEELKDKELKFNYGASKGCLSKKSWDYVIKWTIVYNEDEDSIIDYFDEAMQEVELYEKSIQNGLEILFPETLFLIALNDINFVIQEKVDVQYCYLENDEKEEKKCKISQKNEKYLNYFISELCLSFSTMGWFNCVIDLYGRIFMQKLFSFISQNRINDLHSANVGFKGNKPKILDFCGFNR